MRDKILELLPEIGVLRVPDVPLNAGLQDKNSEITPRTPDTPEISVVTLSDRQLKIARAQFRGIQITPPPSNN